MLAIKANYNNGKITFIEQFPDQIKKAKLTIIVEPEDETGRTSIPGQEYMVRERDHESEYKLIGLSSFFDTEDDKSINWEDYFGLK